MNKINKNNIIIFILCVILIIGVILIFKMENKNEKIENTTDSIKEVSYSRTSKEMDFMLAELLKKDDEIVITEDNIDKSKEIIKKSNLKNGIFVVESSRDMFLKLINECTENTYTIDNEGYLQKPLNIVKESDLTTKINDYIDSQETLIIKITSTYKELVDDMQLDIMVDKDAYVEKFDYNSAIKIKAIKVMAEFEVRGLMLEIGIFDVGLFLYFIFNISYLLFLGTVFRAPTFKFYNLILL